MKNNTFNYLRLKSLQKISKGDDSPKLSETWDHFKVLYNVDNYLEVISKAFQSQEDEIKTLRKTKNILFIINLYNLCLLFVLIFISNLP